MIMPEYIAHRGASRIAPENTLAAFLLAKEQGATWVECDVAITRDRTAVIFHDDELSRTSSGYGKLADKTLQELKTLDAGEWFADNYKGETIPTLTEALNELHQLELGVNLEIKPQFFACQQKFQVMVDAIERALQAGLEKIVLSSFSIRALSFFKDKLPMIPRGLLMQFERPDWQYFAKQLQCKSIHLSASIASTTLVQSMKTQGYQVYCYTVNDADDATRLFDSGVDGVFTDNLFKTA